MTTRADAEPILRKLTGNVAARFRPGQWEAVAKLVVERGRVLVVQRTGWGKSAVYFLATRLLRDRGAGPTLLISPLLALMRDQKRMAERAGVRAASVASDNKEEWEAVKAKVEADELDLLLISPERLQNRWFQDNILTAVATRVGLLVVDEAHCISDWGHDFRPDYRHISRVLGLLPSTVPVLCTTATANNRVVEDIVVQLGESLEIQRGPLARDSLHLSVVDLPSQAERLAWLATVLPTLPGTGIVYCLTVPDTERVAAWLQSEGIDAAAYSSATGDLRPELEARLGANDLKALVATSALGMGYDKPDLAFVVHFQAPGTAVDYYQQVGRAGRAIDKAYGVLLRGAEDVEIQDYFIKSAFPVQHQAERVVQLLEERAEPMSVYDIEAEVNIRHVRLAKMLQLLEVEGAVERYGSKWRRTLRRWSYDTERVRRVTAARRAEQAAMVEYAETYGCRMAFLRELLDDPAEPCGRCDTCTGETWSVPLDTQLTVRAAEFLRHRNLPIRPRLRWPYGLGEPSGSIPVDQQVAEGRALSLYGDGGWGRVVQRAKYKGGAFPDELVAAVVELVRGWAPEPTPTWVTSVPSTSHPELVPAFAERVAAGLGLPFIECLKRTRAGPPQKNMDNSAQQVVNVYGAFEVQSSVPSSPVLLVDDVVDSRWTITVVGKALREAGVDAVYPVALAQAAWGS